MTRAITFARAACTLFSLTAVLSLSSRAHAEEPAHEGFYFRGGFGPTFLTLRGHNPTGGTASLTGLGNGSFLAVGGGIAHGLSLAGTLQGASIDADFKGGPFAHATVTADGAINDASRNALANTGMLGVLVDWYPKPSGGFHTGVAAGLGVLRLTNMAGRDDFLGADFAYGVFGGYDWRLARNVSLGLQLAVNSGTQMKLKNDQTDTGYELTPLSVGVQASLLCF